MSDCATNFRKSSRPSGRRVSSPTDSLFREYWTQDSETDSPGTLPSSTGRRGRVGSAYGGSNGGPSTWITRAPNSPRYVAAQGPATNRADSSTRTPERGPNGGTSGTSPGDEDTAPNRGASR